MACEIFLTSEILVADVTVVFSFYKMLNVDNIMLNSFFSQILVLTFLIYYFVGLGYS